MVEIALLLAGAETAISSIKKAIQVGKDAHQCLGEFMKLFDAQDAINRASLEERSKAPEKSAMAEAMESVMAARRVKEMMDELQQFLIYSGQADVWQEIMRERNAVIQKRKAAQLELERQAAKKRQQREDLIEICVVTAASVALGAMVLWGTYLIVKYLY